MGAANRAPSQRRAPLLFWDTGGTPQGRDWDGDSNSGMVTSSSAPSVTERFLPRVF